MKRFGIALALLLVSIVPALAQKTTVVPGSAAFMSLPVSSANGGTGQSNASAVSGDVVDFTTGGVMQDSSTLLSSLAPLNSPSFTTPTLGVAIGTSLALGGCTISTNAFCTTGTASINGTLSMSGGNAITGGGNIQSNNAAGYQLSSGAATCTAPTLVPDKGTTTTGVGGAGTTLCFDEGGTDEMDFASTTGATWTIPSGAHVTFADATIKLSGLSAAAGANVVCSGTGGLLTTEPLATTCSGSNGDWKDHVKAIDPGQALIILTRLRPVSFQYKPKYKAQMGFGTHYGLIAQDVDKVAPWLVARDAKGDIQGVKYAELPAWIIAALQEQHQEILLLSKRIARLEQHK